jgi:hypothetical protein
MNGYNTRSKPDVPAVFEFLLQQTVIISKESACVVYCRQAFDAEAHGRIIFSLLASGLFLEDKNQPLLIWRK